MSIKYPIDHPHTLSVDELIQAFQTDATQGISDSEAKQRAIEFGANVYKVKKPKSIWLMIVLQFKSPIVYLLLVAVLLTLYFRDYIESAAIMGVIVINALIGFLMELQAVRSMNSLKKMDVAFSKVIRDGKIQKIPSETLVP